MAGFYDVVDEVLIVEERLKVRICVSEVDV